MARMRSIEKAYRELKSKDPETDLTLNALKGLVKSGIIPSIPIGEVRKVLLINVDDLVAMVRQILTAPSNPHELDEFLLEHGYDNVGEDSYDQFVRFK